MTNQNATETARAARATILVVDDERNMRDTLAEILEADGYQVETADSGEAAVERCDQRTFDVVLMDVRMPGINGVEAFRRIRSHNPTARVILMSAYTIDDLRRVALEEGAAALLPKPLDLDTVVRLIDRVQDTSILLVGDDTETQESISNALTDQGFRVHCAHTPAAALDIAGQIHFDVVFIESEVGSTSGLDLYLVFRRVTPSVIAVMISDRTRNREAIAREAVFQSAYTVVHKPVDIQDLLQLINRICSERASNDVHKPGLS